MLGVKVEQVNAKLGHAARDTAVLISALRTPLWLPSGWECRDRHLSRRRKNPDMRCGSLSCHLATRRHGLDQGKPRGRTKKAYRSRDDPGFSGIPLPLELPLAHRGIRYLADK